MHRISSTCQKSGAVYRLSCFTLFNARRKEDKEVTHPPENDRFPHLTNAYPPVPLSRYAKPSARIHSASALSNACSASSSVGYCSSPSQISPPRSSARIKERCKIGISTPRI